MRKENVERLQKYVEKTSKPFSRLTNSVKELENMHNARLSGKEWQEKHEKHEFYPEHPAIKSIKRKAKHLALKKAKK